MNIIVNDIFHREHYIKYVPFQTSQQELSQKYELLRNPTAFAGIFLLTLINLVIK
jgi:hypothetical protein